MNLRSENFAPSLGSLLRGRANNFNVLRLVLAVSVIVSHSFTLLGGTGTSEPLWGWTGRMSVGMVAVGWFFTLSGYLITQSWTSSGGLADFLRKRVLRVYPGFLLALLFCVLVVAPLGAESGRAYFESLDFSRLGLGLLLLIGYPFEGVFTRLPYPNAVNGSLWTIPYEFVCYLFTAVLGVAGLVSIRWTIPALFLGSFGGYCALQGMHPKFEHPVAAYLLGYAEGMPRLVTCYLAGATCFVLRDWIPFSRRLALVSLAGLTMSVLLIKGLHLAFPIFGTYLLFYAAAEPRLGMQNFGRKVDLSYGMYLFAFPVQQLLIMWAGERLNPVSLSILAVLVTAVLAYLSWQMVEKPCLQLKRERPFIAEPATVANLA